MKRRLGVLLRSGHGRRSRWPLLGGSLFLSSVARLATAQALAPEAVVQRANEYVLNYEKQFSVVVSEERYWQWVLGHDGAYKQSRQLVSDMLTVRLPDSDRWLAFRDVFQVDGSRVRDRDERLQKLFLESPATAVNQARRIADESARFNIGSVVRNINVPTMALAVLHPSNRHRFSFDKIGEEAIEGTDTWAIQYTEQVRPTLIRAGADDILARGTFWIDPVQGRVVRSELIATTGGGDLRSQITVTYRPAARLDIWVPSEMKETYDTPRIGGDSIRCVATYTNFRRFQVQVEERIKPPK